MWQQEGESTTVADTAANTDLTLVHIGDVLYDGQSQPGATEFTAARLVSTIKAFKQPRNVNIHNTGPLIAHINADMIRINPRCNFYDRVIGTVFNRIVDQVHNGLGEQGMIDMHT